MESGGVTEIVVMVVRMVEVLVLMAGSGGLLGSR